MGLILAYCSLYVLIVKTRQKGRPLTDTYLS
jgi:hypothetical protein